MTNFAPIFVCGIRTPESTARHRR